MKRGYKAKTISRILASKFEDFTSSIKDEKVKDAVEKNTIITGGCIVSYLSGEEPNDFDIYFRDKETCQLVAEYYVKEWQASGEDSDVKVESEYNRVRIKIPSRGVLARNKKDIYTLGDSEEPKFEHDSKGYEPVFLSSNAITLSNKIQLVIRFFGEADVIHKTYDFAHCTNHWDSKTGKLKLRKAALESILSKELIYTGSLYPVCSVIRLRKFISRGWAINAGQILKMLLQISELDLTNPKILEDQLVGVDSAYFFQLIESIKEKDPKKINAAYLGELIDRIF